MGNYDRAVFDAKDATLRVIGCKKTDAEKVQDLATVIDQLNKAWDDLTDQLVRQREARDETIAHLHNVIADLRRPK